GDDHRKPRVMRQCRFVRLAVPQTSAWQICTVRRINYHRAFPLAERTPAQTAYVGHQLVPTGPDEVDELQFENGTLAVRTKAAGDTKNRRFRQRRVENLIREFSGKFLRQPKDTPFRILNVFAEDDASFVALEPEPQRFVNGIANPIFSRRQNFVVQLRKFSCDLEEELVG